MKTAFLEDLSKAVTLLSQKKAKLDIRLIRYPLKVLEYSYLRKVIDSLALWRRQWLKIQGQSFSSLYSYAQRIPESEKGFVFKSVYDIPPEYRRIIESSVRITPDNAVLIHGTFEHLEDVYNTSCSGLSSVLGSNVAFQLRDRDILRALELRSNMLAGNVSETTFNRLKHRLATSFFVEGKHPTLRTVHPVTGQRMSSVAEDIQGFFAGQVQRARTVARTETMVAQSAAEFDFNERVGIQRHGWMATVEDTQTPPRPAHFMNHAHVVNIGDPFPDGQIMVGQGPPELTINCRCLSCSTSILTDKGNVQLKDIEVGDKVLSWEGEKAIFCPVKRVYHNGHAQEWIELVTYPSIGFKINGYRVLICTPEHKILQGGKFVDASSLSEGEKIVRPVVWCSSWVFENETLVSVKRFSGLDEKMDLEVEGSHNYCAGGMVVHNCSNYPVVTRDVHIWDGSRSPGGSSLPGFEIETAFKAWSEEAREAALEARRANMGIREEGGKKIVSGVPLKSNGRTIFANDKDKIRSYTDTAYMVIRDNSQGEWPPEDIHTSPFNDQFPTKEKVEEFEAELEKSLLKLDGWEGISYRTLQFNEAEELGKFLNEHEVGTVVRFKSFQSSTKDFKIAERRSAGNSNKVILQIKGRTGRDITKYSVFDHEQEVLFMKNSTFKVRGAQRKRSFTQIDLEEI